MIEPFQMGDIAALSALWKPLKSRFPKAKIWVLGKKNAVDLAGHFEEVDEAVSATFPWTEKGSKMKAFKSWLSDMRALNKHGFDLGLDVRGDVRSHISLLLAGCKSVVSYRQYVNSDIFNHGLLCDLELPPSPYSHVLDKNRYLITGLGFKQDDLFPLQFPLANIKSGFTNQVPVPVLFHIGASWEFKRWPARRWVELLTLWKAEGWDTPSLVVGPGEQHLAQSVLDALPSGFDFPPVLAPDLSGLLRLLSQTPLLIGADSGPMTIANTIGTPRIAIFGPGDPGVWGPYQKPQQTLHEIAQYPCYPCIQKVCLHPDAPCTSRIQAKDVVEIARNIL